MWQFVGLYNCCQGYGYIGVVFEAASSLGGVGAQGRRGSAICFVGGDLPDKSTMYSTLHDDDPECKQLLSRFGSHGGVRLALLLSVYQS